MKFDEIPTGTTDPRNAADDADLDVYADSPLRFNDLETGDSLELRKAKTDARKKYGGIHRAINEARVLGDAYKYKSLSALTAPTVIADALTFDLDPDAADVEFTAVKPNDATAPNTLPTYEGEKDGRSGDAAEALAVPGKPDKTIKKPAVPKSADYGSDNLYLRAINDYVDLYNEYVPNANAWAKYNAYIAAVKKEQGKDREEQLDAIADGKFTAKQLRAISSGRDTLTGHDPDPMRYPYLVVLTPKYANTNDVVVKVNEFEDLTSPVPEKYIPPALESGYDEGIDKLTIKVAAAKAKVSPDLGAGSEVMIPKDKRIPASGYLVVATSVAGSGIAKPAGSDKEEPKATDRTPAQLKYNVVEAKLPNLETFLTSGGTIALVAPAGVYISEIMWGSDASLEPNNNSQWIEIANSGATSILTGDKTHKLIFYGPNETPVSTGVADTVSTVGWSTIAGIGQSGRTGTGEKAADVVAVVPTQSLISMQRKMNADGTVADGTMSSGWAASAPPGFNFDLSAVGVRVGTPGASPTTVPTVVVTPAKPAPTVAVATSDDIDITEIMVDTDSGRLPQWIELTSSATGEVSLNGWNMVIDNAIDADVIGGGNAITVSLSGATLDVSKHTGNTGKGQSVLVVAWAASRHSANISADRIINVATQLNQKAVINC